MDIESRFEEISANYVDLKTMLNKILLKIDSNNNDIDPRISEAIFGERHVEEKEQSKLEENMSTTKDMGQIQQKGLQTYEVELLATEEPGNICIQQVVPPTFIVSERNQISEKRKEPVHVVQEVVTQILKKQKRAQP